LILLDFEQISSLATWLFRDLVSVKFLGQNMIAKLNQSK